MASKLLVIDLVGLTPNVLKQMPGVSGAFSDRGQTTHLIPPLPALTCTSQATITTGTLPGEHGVVSNGWYFRDMGEIRFWLRSDHLVGGEKIWEAAKKSDSNISVANLFWRFCTHSHCDITVTERPTYWANGRKSSDVFTNPGTLRNDLVEKLGEFPLFRFWGPATSITSAQWIADATLHVMQSADPDLTLTYLPHLDYDLQKFGPQSDESIKAIQEVDAVATNLIDEARALRREIVVLSEYGITEVNRPVFLNRALRKAGLLTVHEARNGELLEPGGSRAFAACSHQIAHIYVRDASDLAAVQSLLASVDGVERVLGETEQKIAGLQHHRSGELLAIAEKDAWFAYPYWLDDAVAPDFARCVAIHDKPGHDPLEMFLGTGGKFRVMRRLLQSKLGFRVPFDVISLDAGLIRGSHGRLPESVEHGPLILTDWNHQASDSMPMTDVKRLILDRLMS